MSQRVLIDSNVVLYALGADSPRRQACRDVLSALADGSLIGVASTEMIQEVVHHRLRMTGDPHRAVADARDTAELVTVIGFDEVILQSALHLIENTGIRGRDAVHAATALTQGITVIVSVDPVFDHMPGLIRCAPGEAITTA